MWRFLLVVAWGISWAALTAGLAYGQPGPAGGVGMPAKLQLEPIVGLTRLLQLSQVQGVLMLSEKQKSQVMPLHNEIQGMFRPDTLGPAERQKAIREEEEKRLAKILKPWQLKRLKEISLQVQPAAALRQPEMIKRLGIRKGQAEQLVKLEEDALVQRRSVALDLRPDQRDPRYAEKMKQWHSIDRQLTHDAIAVLTEEQRKNFRLMIGKKIDLDLQSALTELYVEQQQHRIRDIQF
jgi:hypothetical protein